MINGSTPSTKEHYPYHVDNGFTLLVKRKSQKENGERM